MKELYESPETIHSACAAATENMLDSDSLLLYKNMIELLSIAVISNPNSLQMLCYNKKFLMLFGDLLLINVSDRLRKATAKQFLQMCICSDPRREIYQKVRELSVSLIHDPSVEKYASQSRELFYFTRQIVNSDESLHDADALLDKEVRWLRNSGYPHLILLEGHLELTRELLDCVKVDKKVEVGLETGGNLIRLLLESYLFPASRAVFDISTYQIDVGDVSLTPKCNDSASISAAYKLLRTLSTNCTPNYEMLLIGLEDLFFLGKTILTFFLFRS